MPSSPTSAGLLYWYTTSAVLGVLTLINIIYNIYLFATRPTPRSTFPSHPLSPSSPTQPKSEPSSANSSPTSQLRLTHADTDSEKGSSRAEHFAFPARCARTAVLAYEKYYLLTSLPRPRWRWWIKRREPWSIPTTELAWNIVYAVAVCALAFYGTAWDPNTFAHQSGLISVAQVPLIIALVGKNNIISFLTGISHERLNFLHRAAGRVCLAAAWVHTIGALYVRRENLGGEVWRTPLFLWGTIGLVAFTLMYLTSLPAVRKWLYEFFLLAHICLCALTLAAFILHFRSIQAWVWPGIGLWILDRLLRLGRLVVLNKLWYRLPSPFDSTSLDSTCSLTLLTPSTLKLIFPAPPRMASWHAGQHFFVIMPGMSSFPWEAHPFTALTIPFRPGQEGGGEVQFVVRVRDGFTRKMKDAVDKVRKERGLPVDQECTIEVKGAVEGAYGAVRDLNRADGVLFIAGGSGISFAVAHTLQIMRDAKDGKTNVSIVRIVWMVKSRLHLNWVYPIILSHLQDIPSSLTVSLHIHVTKQYRPRGSVSLPPQAVLPTDPSKASRGWADYLAQRMVEPPRRKSRLMSTLSWATWTSAHHADGTSTHGPGTRRGSHYHPAEERKRTSHEKRASHEKEQNAKEDHDNEKRHEDARELQVQVNREKTPVPTFRWSEAYADGQTLPAGEFGTLRTSDRLRVSHDEPPCPTVSEESPSQLIDTNTPPPPSPFGTAESRAPSFAFPRKLSFDPTPIERLRHLGAAGAGSLSPTTRRDSLARFSTPPMSPLARPRQVSISISEPRRDSTVSSSGSQTSGPSEPPSISLHRPSGPILLKPPQHHLQQQQHDDPSSSANLLSFEFTPASPGPSPPDGVTPARATTTSDDPDTHPSGLMAPQMMARTSSAQSNLSIMTVPPVGSGALTPQLSETGAQTFKDDAPARRQSSAGLEGIVRWYEGRADLREAVDEMFGEVPRGGEVKVEVCGPRSLLESSRNVVREMQRVEAGWKGETKLSFHAETFGW